MANRSNAQLSAAEACFNSGDENRANELCIASEINRKASLSIGRGQNRYQTGANALIGLGVTGYVEGIYNLSASAGLALSVTVPNNTTTVIINDAKLFWSASAGVGTLGMGIGPAVGITPGTADLNDFYGFGKGIGGSFAGIGPGTIGLDVAPGPTGHNTWTMSYTFGPNLTREPIPNILKAAEVHGNMGFIGSW